MTAATCECRPGYTCRPCTTDLALVAALLKPIPPDQTRAQAVLAELDRQGLVA